MEGARLSGGLLQRGVVKLIQRLKIAHSFLQSASNLFYFIILNLSMQFYIWLSKNISRPTSKIGEIGHLIGKLKLIMRNRFDTDCKNE